MGWYRSHLPCVLVQLLPVLQEPTHIQVNAQNCMKLLKTDTRVHEHRHTFVDDDSRNKVIYVVWSMRSQHSTHYSCYCFPFINLPTLESFYHSSSIFLSQYFNVLLQSVSLDLIFGTKVFNRRSEKEIDEPSTDRLWSLAFFPSSPQVWNTLLRKFLKLFSFPFYKWVWIEKSQKDHFVFLNSFCVLSVGNEIIPVSCMNNFSKTFSKHVCKKGGKKVTVV